MTSLLTLGAAFLVGYRPSALAAFAITIISLAAAVRATVFPSMRQIGRLRAASIEFTRKNLEKEISEEDREEARLNLLRKVLDMPVVDCATDATTNESVRSALELLLSFEDREAGADLQ